MNQDIHVDGGDSEALIELSNSVSSNICYFNSVFNFAADV